MVNLKGERKRESRFYLAKESQSRIDFIHILYTQIVGAYGYQPSIHLTTFFPLAHPKRSLSSLSLSSVVVWMKQNIVGTVLIFSFIVWLPLGCLVHRYDLKQRAVNAGYGMRQVHRNEGIKYNSVYEQLSSCLISVILLPSSLYFLSLSLSLPSFSLTHFFFSHTHTHLSLSSFLLFLLSLSSLFFF